MAEKFLKGLADLTAPPTLRRDGEDSFADVAKKLHGVLTAQEGNSVEELRQCKADASSTHRAIRQFVATPLGAKAVQLIDERLAAAKRTGTIIEQFQKLLKDQEAVKVDAGNIGSDLKNLTACRKSFAAILAKVQHEEDKSAVADARSKVEQLLNAGIERLWKHHATASAKSLHEVLKACNAGSYSAPEDIDKLAPPKAGDAGVESFASAESCLTYSEQRITVMSFLDALQHMPEIFREGKLSPEE